jgi:hypothetical protein
VYRQFVFLGKAINSYVTPGHALARSNAANELLCNRHIWAARRSSSHYKRAVTNFLHEDLLELQNARCGLLQWLPNSSNHILLAFRLLSHSKYSECSPDTKQTSWKEITRLSIQMTYKCYRICGKKNIHVGQCLARDPLHLHSNMRQQNTTLRSVWQGIPYIDTAICGNRTLRYVVCGKGSLTLTQQYATIEHYVTWCVARDHLHLHSNMRQLNTTLRSVWQGIPYIDTAICDNRTLRYVVCGKGSLTFTQCLARDHSVTQCLERDHNVMQYATREHYVT